MIVTIIFICFMLHIISKSVSSAVIVILIVILMIIKIVIILLVTVHLVLGQGLLVLGVVFHVVVVEVLVSDVHHRHGSLDTSLYKLVLFLRPTKLRITSLQTFVSKK